MYSCDRDSKKAFDSSSPNLSSSGIFDSVQSAEIFVEDKSFDNKGEKEMNSGYENEMNVELGVRKPHELEKPIEGGQILCEQEEIEPNREHNVDDEYSIGEHGLAIGQRGREHNRLGDVLKDRDEKDGARLVVALGFEPYLRAHELKRPHLSEHDQDQMNEE